MRLSRRAWQAIALSLFLIAVVWGACGLLLYATPSEPSDALPDPDSVGFQITRGCCLGPALVLAFLAYLTFTVSRRRDPILSWPALFAVLGAALGLMVALVGVAIVVRPAADDTDTTRIAFTALCILPGLSLMGVSAIFWLLVGRPR